MKHSIACAALVAGTLVLAPTGDVRAHGRALFTTSGTRCNGCHTGGAAPGASFSPGANARKTGGGLRIVAGQAARLALDVDAPPDRGLGLAITAGDGLTLEAEGDATRVERQILAHRLVIPVPTGKYHLPFTVRAPEANCGRSFVLSASVASVDRNGSPAGDGTTTSATSVFVECAGAAGSAPAAEPPRPAAQATVKPSVAPTLPAVSAGAADAPRVMTPTDNAARTAAPTAVLTRPATVSVNQRRTADNAVQLGILNEHEISATPEPGVAEFKAGLSQPGEAKVFFHQGAGYVIVDCVMGRARKVALTIDAPPLNFKLEVPIVDGHAVAVVPPTSLKRPVQLAFMGSELRWSISSCKLIPVP
jgi:hypothetical protein